MKKWVRIDSVFSLSLSDTNLKREKEYCTCTACRSYRDMEFMVDVRELGPDAFVEALCWFCSPSASIRADDTVLNIFFHLIQSNPLY